MATYMSRTRDVLVTTITNVTSYNSGSLNVGNIIELTVDINITSHTGGNNVNFSISRVDAFGNTYQVSATGSTTTTILSSRGVGRDSAAFFGDQIQITLNNPNADTVSATISVKGKG